MRIRLIAMSIVAAFAIVPAGQVSADLVTPSVDAYDIAGFPRDGIGTGTGNHFHNNPGTGLGEVGFWGNVEQMRTAAEFNLSAQPLASSAIFQFDVNSIARIGDFDINVVAYTGNNTGELSDYEAASVLVGTFSTSGSQVDDVHSFDITALYNAAVVSGESLGMRLQIATLPSGNFAVTYDNFRIDAAEAIPEPSSVALLGIGACVTAAGAFRRRRRKGKQESAGTDD